MKRTLLLTLATIFMAVGGSAATPVIGDYDTLWNKALSDVIDLKFHPNGETFVVSREWSGLSVYNSQTGEFIREFTHNLPLPSQNKYWSFDISSDGSYLMAVDYAQRCYFWNYNTGQFIRGFDQRGWDVKSYANNSKFMIMTKRSDYTYWIYDFMQDSVVEVGIKEICHNIATGPFAVSPDGKYIALSAIYTVNGEDEYCVAIYDAQTLEKVTDIPEIILFIEEITFSQNSKWLALRAGYSTLKILNFEKYLQDQSIEEKEFQYTNRPSFLGTDNFVIISNHYPVHNTFIIDLKTNDTTYYLNYRLYHISANANNHLIIGQRSSHHTVMLNTNWYTVGVTEPDTASIISTLNYLNSVLTYTLSISNPASIVISNSIGNIIFTTENVLQNGTIELPLSSGAYFFTVSDGNKSYTKQFWVVR